MRYPTIFQTAQHVVCQHYERLLNERWQDSIFETAKQTLENSKLKKQYKALERTLKTQEEVCKAQKERIDELETLVDKAWILTQHSPDEGLQDLNDELSGAGKLNKGCIGIE